MAGGLFMATRQFLEEINKWTSQHGVSPLSRELAVKFLMARKFDVLRAIELFHSYRETRLKEGIVRLQPQEEPLRSELLSGKFTVLPPVPENAGLFAYKGRFRSIGGFIQVKSLWFLLTPAAFKMIGFDMKNVLECTGPFGASIALYTAKLHHPNKTGNHVVLQALFYLLDRAVESFETQRNGLGAFPARLKKVLIVGALFGSECRTIYSVCSSRRNLGKG
ncbi:hypothetical protein INR49_024910 [Caranx melampygus]|nr:hypothetical protein INR49_024910 [Caranx melampygus]